MKMLQDVPYMNPGTPNPPQYTILYKSLLEHAPALGLSLDAVYLYSYLCALAGLSAVNGLSDSRGHLYVICPRSRAAELLGCSVRKVSAVFGELVHSGLICVVKRANRAKCNVAPYIYLRQWNEPSLTLSMEEIIKGQLPPLTANNVSVITGVYYRIPTVLDRKPFISLSVRARVLYAIALDTMALSCAYNRADVSGYWCSVDAADAQRWLQCGHGSLSGAYKELMVTDLLERKRVEPGCPMHTYLRPCWNVPAEQPLYCGEPDVAPQLAEKDTCSHPESAAQTSNPFQENNLIQSTCYSQSHPTNLRAVARDRMCKEKLPVQDEIPGLMRELYLVLPWKDYERAADILELINGMIAQTIAAPEPGFCVDKKFVSKGEVITVYGRLNCDDLCSLVHSLLPLWHTVKAPVPYLRAALYRTAMSGFPGRGTASAGHRNLKNLAH